MIQPARFPIPETTIAMDPQHPHPNEAPTPAQADGSSPIAVAPNSKPDSAGRWIEHPLQAILGAVIVLLLGFALTQTNDRISRLEDRVDTGFAQIDQRFAAQDAKFDEINLKLTALIAALNATSEVEAALEGRLLDPNASPADEPTN